MPIASTAAFRTTTAAVSGQQTYEAEDTGGPEASVFPLTLVGDHEASTAAAADWAAANADELCRLATANGAVLLRDFPLPDVESFDALVASLGLENFPYRKSLSNAVRINRTERVFSANEAPPEVQIFFHHEMAQTPLYPQFILFYCEIAAESGGATPICRSDVLYRRLKASRPEFAARCEAVGLRYSNVMPEVDDPESGMGRSWGSTLGVDDRGAAEDRLRELGYSWEWHDDGSLRATTPPLPAVMDLPDGRQTFFNQLIAAYSGWKDARNDPSDAIRHGDGSRLDPDAVAEAIAIADELAFDVAWRPGDAVLIDNRVAMHARRTFAGKRKVVASLAQMQTQSFEPAGA